MNKFTYTLLSLLFFLPLNIMAQEELTIIENGESQSIKGTVITISDSEEYISNDLKLYKVKVKNLALLGDVVKDLAIDIKDITTMVDMIMENDYSVVADITKDGEVNISDVTTAVDTALGIEEEEIYVESYVVEDLTTLWIKSSCATAVDQH